MPTTVNTTNKEESHYLTKGNAMKTLLRVLHLVLSCVT